MTTAPRGVPSRGMGAMLTDPRYRRLHATIIAAAVLLHLAMHYATYIPALRDTFSDLPYFRLHVLHEAEFLLIVSYAGIVFRLKGGLTVLAVTAITSIPFILTPYFFDRAPRPDEIHDLTIQVAAILLMGGLIVLMYEIETRRRQTEAAMSSLRESDRVRTNFVSMASHELRNPLTVLYGFSELLMREGASEDQRRDWAGRMHRQIERLTHMVDDLLSVSRIESGKITVMRERVDIAPIVQEAVRMTAPTSEDDDIRVDIPANISPVSGDREKLVQVLINLVSNAVKYSPNGGQVTVSVREDRDRGKVLVSVEDKGIGISPEDQAQLFTLFYRVRRVETDNIQGNGLGLYIVKSLVDLMGGDISVKSESGKGSVFSFTLPLWQAEAPAATGSGV